MACLEQKSTLYFVYNFHGFEFCDDCQANVFQGWTLASLTLFSPPKFISTGYISFSLFKLSLLFFIIWDSVMCQASPQTLCVAKEDVELLPPLQVLGL